MPITQEPVPNSNKQKKKTPKDDDKDADRLPCTAVASENEF